MAWILRSVALIWFASFGPDAACAARATDPAHDAWSTLARADVESIHDSVVGIHPAIRDLQSPRFEADAEAAYRLALERAAAAKSFLDWRAAVNGFVLSFRDGHTFIRFNAQPTRLRWPGFLLDGRGDAYVAMSVAPDLHGVEAGDTLLACDGVPTASLLQQRLDVREADWSKPPERLRQAWRLFVDFDVDGPAKLSRCTFLHGQAREEVTLQWRAAPAAALLALAEPLQRLRPAPQRIAFTFQPDRSALITVGSLGNEGALQALATALRADSAELHNAPYVVFDLRGNRGGNSTWGETLGAITFGDDAVAAIENPPLGKYFRASTQAVARLRATAAEFAAAGPDMASVADYWRKIADRVAASPQGDRQLFTDYEAAPPAPVASTRPAPPAGRPVFVLTDAGCFSSCVIAANTLVALGGISVGEMTGQNEEYGEITGPLPLPSGLANYWLPLSIIRQHREQLGGQPVMYGWPGAMDDDPAILAWIAHLAALQVRP